MQAHANGTALRRVLAGSVVGTALEWYDFFACGVSLVAFLASEETKDLDIGLEKPAQDALVSAPKVAKEEEKPLEPVAS